VKLPDPAVTEAPMVPVGVLAVPVLLSLTLIVHAVAASTTPALHVIVVCVARLLTGKDDDGALVLSACTESIAAMYLTVIEWSMMPLVGV
jgi:hypothetical protein